MENQFSQFQLVPKIHEPFWNQWHHEYITKLLACIKWKRNTSRIAMDEVVLIKDNNLPALKWKFGRILSLTSEKDGISRVAVVKEKLTDEFLDQRCDCARFLLKVNIP